MIDTVIETTSTVLSSQTEERLRLANRATNDAIWEWSFKSGHVGWSEALTVAYGHEIADVEPTTATLTSMTAATSFATRRRGPSE